jgi:redox-sensitive bicupin YhaK (pirin superfamily)
MTAGAGILHIETPPEELVVSGGLFHGLQLWVNLPAKAKMINPKYQDIHGGNVKLLTTPDGGSILRLIAGELAGVQGPGATHTPITMIHATLSPGARITLPWRRDFNALVYALNGNGTVGEENRPFHMGQAVVFGEGDSISVQADAKQESRSPNLDVVILGGEPIREPVAHYGPFVMNSHRELQQAIEDFNSGRFGQIPAEHA